MQSNATETATAQCGADQEAAPQTSAANTMQFVRQLAVDLQKGEFDLPPFPDTALRVQECIRDPSSDISSLAAIVATEPALAARLMRMANSAMMRRGPIEVVDIPTAISRVGTDMVQNAAVSFAAREAFKEPPGGACIGELRNLRKTSVETAAIAYFMAKRLGNLNKPDEAMLAGLLSAVGKFYIFTKASDHPDLFQDRETLEQLVADWHTGVARAIVESWEFPETIAIAVDEQEVEEKDRSQPGDLSDVLYLAKVVAETGATSLEQLAEHDTVKRLGINTSELQETLLASEEEIASMVAAMS